MKKFLSVLVLSGLVLALVVPAAEARRLGGGGNIGRQSSSPAMREAPREAPRATPNAAPAQSSAAAAPAAAGAVPPKPSFMSRYGGMIAGLGAGALLASMFGGSLGGLGSAMGGILNILLIVGALYLAYRFFIARRRTGSSSATAPMQFAGAGGPSFDANTYRREPSSAAPFAMSGGASRTEAVVRPGINVPPGFEIEPFVRQAQSSFLRLQAANDDRDLADIRDTTTPEVYAELAMQIRERGDAPQKTDVVSLDAQLLEVVIEGEQMLASLRYSGTIRESAGAAAQPFDEVWHLRKSAHAVNDPWLIAGIQQMA
ncbi:MAG: Tim44-like domain-containing protein [Burkholderiaceae bacterium]